MSSWWPRYDKEDYVQGRLSSCFPKTTSANSFILFKKWLKRNWGGILIHFLFFCGMICKSFSLMCVNKLATEKIYFYRWNFCPTFAFHCSKFSKCKKWSVLKIEDYVHLRVLTKNLFYFHLQLLLGQREVSFLFLIRKLKKNVFIWILIK